MSGRKHTTADEESNNIDDVDTRYYSLFLHNLEQWIGNIISRDDGLRDGKAMKKVKESFNCAMQSNIEYHMFMAENESKCGEHSKADCHRQMAQVYQELLSNK